jgi:hypothetical protein
MARREGGVGEQSHAQTSRKGLDPTSPQPHPDKPSCPWTCDMPPSKSSHTLDDGCTVLNTLGVSADVIWWPGLGGTCAVSGCRGCVSLAWV